MKALLAPRANPLLALKRKRRAARGAAFVEGVMVVTFMIIVFFGIQYLARYFDAKQQALATARRCAWLFSKNACVDDARHPLPEECREVVGGRVENDPDTGLRDAIDEHAGNSGPGTARNSSIPGQTDAPAETSTEDHLRGGVNRSMHPLLELVVGQSLTAVASKDIERTRVTANAAGSIGASYYLPCNLAKRDPFDVVKELWEGLVSIP